MLRPTLLASTMLLALAACSRDSDQTEATNLDLGSANESLANETATAAPAAAEFVNQAAASDLYEIEAGRLAAEKATNPEVKSFGQMLVTDHSKSSEELKAAAAGLTPPVTPPAALPADKQAKIDALRAASSADFDRLFLEQQVEAHSATLDLLNGYAAGGDTEALKAFAGKAAGVVQGHLERARSLQQ